MRKARLDRKGELRCRKCGSMRFIAREEERSTRTKHLKCDECGKRQRFREPKVVAGGENRSPRQKRRRR